jgi:hypothetical protein
MGSTSHLGRASDRLCVRCGRRANSWQHRVAAGRGGPTDAFNCVPLCGDGTRGCHGWAEHNVTAAREVFLDIPGRFVRGRYEGSDPMYRWHYNGEAWDDEAGWVDADATSPTDPIHHPHEVWT